MIIYPLPEKYKWAMIGGWTLKPATETCGVKIIGSGNDPQPVILSAAKDLSFMPVDGRRGEGSRRCEDGQGTTNSSACPLPPVGWEREILRCAQDDRLEMGAIPSGFSPHTFPSPTRSCNCIEHAIFLFAVGRFCDTITINSTNVRICAGDYILPPARGTEYGRNEK